MANFMDYLKNAGNEMANIARQQQADQVRAQLDAVREAQRQEAERQRAEREAEAARKRAEQEAKVAKAQAEADAKRAEAEAKAMKNIKDKASTVKNWLTSEDYGKDLGGFASDVAKEVGTGLNRVAKNVTIDAPAVAIDAASTNLQNNLQKQYVGAIDEFGQAQYDEVMNPDYTPIKNTNYGDFLRNSDLNELYGNIDEALANDLRGTRVGGFTEGVAQQIPNALAGNLFGSGASLGLMGVSSFGSSGQQALDQGATPGRAALYGLANAAVELGTENISDGIPGVNMKGGIMPLLGEGLEEFAGGVIDPYTEIALGNKNIVDATQEAFSKENLKSALEQGVSGALSAGVMNAGQMMLTNPQGVADRVTGNNNYKRAINDINSQLEIAEQAVTINPNDVGAQMQRDTLLAARTQAQRAFATPANLNSDDSVTRNAARQANMDIIEDTARTSGAKLSSAELRNIASIANKVGARVEFASEPINGTDGFQDANGVLQINANAKDPVMTIFAHELTHATQGTRQYDQLFNTLMDMAESGEISSDGINAIANNPNLTEQQKYDETVATLAQEVFGNSDAIQNLANRNGSLIDRAIQTAKDFMSGNNSVTKAERAMQRAIKNADTRNLASSNTYVKGQNDLIDALDDIYGHNASAVHKHVSEQTALANKLLQANPQDLPKYIDQLVKKYKKRDAYKAGYITDAQLDEIIYRIEEYINDARERGVIELEEVENEDREATNLIQEVTGDSMDEIDFSSLLEDGKAKKSPTKKDLKNIEKEGKSSKKKENKSIVYALKDGLTDAQRRAVFESKMDEGVRKAESEGKVKSIVSEATAEDTTDTGYKPSGEYVNAPVEQSTGSFDYIKKNALKRRNNKSGIGQFSTIYNEEMGVRQSLFEYANFLESEGDIRTANAIRNGSKGKLEEYINDMLGEKAQYEKRLKPKGLTEAEAQVDKFGYSIKNKRYRSLDDLYEDLNDRGYSVYTAKEFNEEFIPSPGNEYADGVYVAVPEWETVNQPKEGYGAIAVLQVDEKVNNIRIKDVVTDITQLEGLEEVLGDRADGVSNLSLTKLENTDTGINEGGETNEPLINAYNIPQTKEAPMTSNAHSVVPVASNVPTLVNEAKPNIDREEYIKSVRDELTYVDENGYVRVKGEKPSTNSGTSTEQEIYDKLMSSNLPAVIQTPSSVPALVNSPNSTPNINREEYLKSVRDELTYVDENGNIKIKGEEPAANHDTNAEQGKVVAQQALMNTLPSANETVTPEVAEPTTETVAPMESVEDSEPITVNDYVTDGDSIAEVVDMQDGQLTLRYENGVTETVDDNGLWNKTEAPQKAEPPVTDKPNTEPSPVQEKPVEPEPPVVEKSKGGEVKVNDESIAKASENITSSDSEVKEQTKEQVKEAVKATIDPKNTHSEAVAQEVADTLEQASTAVNEVNQQWEESVKNTNVTTGEKGITKEKTVSKVMPKEAAEEYELKKEAGGPIAEYEKVSKIEYIKAGEKALEGKDLRACAQAYIDTPTNRNSVAATQQQATGLAIATHLGMEYENIKNANNIKVNKKGQYTINGKELSKDSAVYKQLADLDLTIQQVMAKERSVVTNAAQAMAMQRWMTAQDPVQKANSIDKAIDMLNAEIKKKFGENTDKLIKNLSQEERTRLAEASSEEYDAVLEGIMKRVGESIPLTWKDRRRSWRYTMMLFNPTTIIRNWGGNVLQQGMHTGKNQIAYLLEKAMVDKYHLTEEQRHHTRADGTKARKNAQTEAVARAYYKDMNIKKLTQSKYLSKSGILNYKRSFNNGILQGMSDIVDWAMNNDKFGDEAFTSGRFVDELARQIDVEGYTVDKDGKTLVKDGKKLDSVDQEEALRKMSTRAYQQALESTYHDFNSFAQWLNTLEDSNKIAGIMVGGVAPFKSTPLNIMRRIGEYSPVGLANAVINNKSEVIKGNMSADTYIDNLAKGLTGTAIMGVGALLSSLGYLKASDKDPDELKAYKQDIGLTSEYALHFTDENGKNYWYTVDWGGPVASVMLSGAEAYEVISDIKNRSDSGQDIFGDDAVASALDITFGLLAPVFATTMLQNVEETFESYQYGGMTNVLEQMLLNYLGQYTPTIGAKINNVLDETKRSASGRTPLERFWRGQVKKIPALDSAYNMVKGEHFLEPSINVKGEEEKNVGKTTFARAIYNFLSPGNYSEDTSTEADRELINLYAQTGDSNVLPESYSNFRLNDTQYKFTAKERTEMNKYIGQNYMKEWEAFQNSSTYKKVGNDADAREYKTDITEKLKTHAINNAKEKYFNRIGMSVLSDRDKIVNRMKDYGADNWQAYTMLSTQSDKDSTGKTINNSKALKIRAQMENAGIYDKVIKDINAGKYEPSDFGLNKTVIGLDAASFAERYMYLDQIENDSDVEEFNNLFKKKKTSGKSSGSSSKSAKAEADAALKLYEKIMKGEISATKSAISKVTASLNKLDAKSYDEIMNKHKQMMNELDLYGM